MIAVRAGTLLVVGFLLAGFLILPRAAHSAAEFGLVGVVLRVESGQDAFLVQQVGGATAGGVWTVRVTDATEARRSNDQFARGTRPVLRLLRVGDLVQVQGWITAGNQIMAQAITVQPGSSGVGAEDSKEIRLRGMIVGMDGRGQGVLHVRAESFVQIPNIWTVRLYPHTRVEGVLQDRERDTRGGLGHRNALSLLRLGDLVEVEGRMLGNQQILAREIRVRSAGLSPVPTPFPIPGPFPTPVPFPLQPVIITPHQGAEIAAAEFPVIGQTAPGAQVRVEVTARFGVFNVPVTSGTVTADQRGFFIFEVRPPLRIPGAIYTITVTATFQGFSAPPTSITVRQL